jgi:O-antigen ligase
MFLIRIFALWRQPELKFSNVELSLSFVIFPLIFSLINVTEKQFAIVQKVVVAGFFVFLCAILYNFIIHIYFENLVRETFANAKAYYWLLLKGPFKDHPSFLAIILAPSIPMCFNLATKATKNRLQWLWLSLIPLLFFIVFVIGSRIGLLVCAGLIVLCAVYFFKKLNLVSKIVLGLSFLVAFGIFQTSTINYTEDPIRKEMKTFAIEKIKERPLFGHGYVTQNAHFNDVENPTEFNNPVTPTLSHFHNTYLDEPFQFGIIGSLPLALLLLYLLYRCVKKRDFFLLVFLAIYIPFFYVELPFNSVKGIMPMMILIGLIMNTQNERMLSHQKQKK